MVIRKPFRFLRRLEKALKERDKVQSDSGPDDETDEATSPLLASSSGKSKTKSTHYSFSKQRRVANVYSFEPAENCK